MDRAKIFFKNAVVLSATSVLLRGIGVAFNSFVASRIGAEGLGLLSLINSVYSFAITFALSGINLASSRLCAEAIGSGDESRVRPVMVRCMLYGLFFGVVGWIGLSSLAPFICEYCIHDIRALSSLNILAPGLPALSVTSALTGYFNAVRRASKSASAQILEQFFRIALTVRLLSGVGNTVETSCFFICLAVMLSEFVVLVYGMILYLIDLSRCKNDAKTSKVAISASMLKIALPVAFSSYIRSALVTIEHMLIPRGLRKSGTSPERALASYGTLHGMALPAVLFPQAFLSSLSVLLVPEVAELRVNGNFEKIRSVLSRTFRITLWFSVGVSGIMLCFSYELGKMLYDSVEAGAYIRLLAPLIPIMYIDSTADSILKGMNEQLYSMRINILDAFMSVLLVTLLIPRFGIAGYLVTIFVSEILNTSMSISRLIKVVEFRPRLFDWLILPTICVIGSCSITKLAVNLGGILFRVEYLGALMQISATIILYIFLLIFTGSVGHSDIRWLKHVVK